MGDYKRLLLLVLIMIGVCLIVGATAIGVIYETALDRERARLVNIAQSQARLMEALARLEAPAANRRRASNGGCAFRRSWKRIASCASRGSARPPRCSLLAETATSSCI